jgi:hypothetical protein
MEISVKAQRLKLMFSLPSTKFTSKVTVLVAWCQIYMKSYQYELLTEVLAAHCRLVS